MGEKMGIKYMEAGKILAKKTIKYIEFRGGVDGAYIEIMCSNGVMRIYVEEHNQGTKILVQTYPSKDPNLFNWKEDHETHGYHNSSWQSFPATPPKDYKWDKII